MECDNYKTIIMRTSNHWLKTIALLSCTVIITSNCGNEDDGKVLWGNDPKNADVIYECEITSGTEGFNIIEDRDDDGSCCIRIEHKSFPESDHCRLFSPNGNLRIIASGPVLQCGVNGYRIDYDKEGRVCNIVDIGEMNDEVPTVKNMKKWLQESLHREPDGNDSTFICRNDDGNISSIDGIDVPDGYKARVYIKEWGPFGGSETDGGMMGVFVSVEHIKKFDGSYVNYLYYNGKLLAELAYWKGVFIKARTYNKRGVMVDTYSDRSMDVAEQAYEDFWDERKWYVDN